MEQSAKTKCNRFLMDKINDDILNELHTELLDKYNIDTKIKELNKRLMKLYKIRNLQMFCYEPLHWVEGFHEAYTDSFEDWNLVAKDKEIDLYKVGLLSAGDLIFICENN